MQADIQDNGLLAEAAALAGATVAIVRHSGQRGTHAEFAALITALEMAAAEYPENPYVAALLTPETREKIAGFARQYDEVPKQSVVNDFKMAALNRCAQAAEWLAANATPQAATEVKRSMIAACQRVAAESREDHPTASTSEEIDAIEVGAIEEVMRALGMESV